MLKVWDEEQFFCIQIEVRWAISLNYWEYVIKVKYSFYLISQDVFYDSIKNILAIYKHLNRW